MIGGGYGDDMGMIGGYGMDEFKMKIRLNQLFDEIGWRKVCV